MNTNRTSKILTVIAVAATAAVATPTASAIPTSYTLTLTEVSSTVLTYTYSNALNPTPFTITPVNMDVWDVSANSSITLSSAFIYDFAESAGEPNQFNRADQAGQPPNAFRINSDLPSPFAGNHVDPNPIIGTDNGVNIILAFVDSAAASETASNGVPESGSSLGLLALSSAALLGLTRLRRRQPA